jgi:hypothetical protein
MPVLLVVGYAGYFADSRTGYPLRSTRERSWRSAKARARPASGITTPAYSPFAPANSYQTMAAMSRLSEHTLRTATSMSAAVMICKS